MFAGCSTETGGHQASRFNPYQDNGGSSLAIAGEDFAVFAADTRLSRGYSILSRNVSKYCRLTEHCAIVSCGMRADIDTLQRNLQAEVKQYIFDHRREPTIEALSQLLSVTLYGRRFFPYYTFNMLVGINSKGKGVVYSYDAIGNTEPQKYGTGGSASSMLLPVLDARLLPQNQTKPPAWPTEQEILQLAQDAMTGAAERDILTGDFVEVVCIKRDGFHAKTVPLRMD